jgi:hypothetical protein
MRFLGATLSCMFLVACKEPGQAPVIAVPPSENTLVGTADGRAFGAKSVGIRFEEGGRTVEIVDFSTGCALGTSFDESPPGSRRLTLRFAKDAWHPGFDEDLPSARVSAELAIRRGDKGFEKRAVVSGHVRVLEVQSPGPVDRPATGKHRAHLVVNDGTGTMEGDIVPLEAGCDEP